MQKLFLCALAFLYYMHFIYVWSLVMYLWPWLPVNHLPVLSLGNDAPAEESCWGLSVCWRRSHWEASIIELDWNPAPAGGWLAGWDRSFSERFCCAKTPKKMLCFSWRWPCCQLWSIRRLISSPAVISGSSEAITATVTSIKLQGEGFEGFSYFAWGFYSSALPLNILLKPKHKIRAGWDECVL